MKVDFVKYMSASFKNKLGIDTPIIWNHKITFRCQALCGFCPFNAKRGLWKKYGEELKTNEVIDMADQMYELGCSVSSFEGGEPLLRVDLPEILKHCKEIGFNVHLVTNGLLLKSKAHLIGSYCDVITVSIDYPDERHSKERGPRIFESALEGIKEAKKYASVTINTVITKGNVKDLKRLVELTENLGINGISFEPVDNVNNFYGPFKHDNRQRFVDAIKELIQLKKEGMPILNSQKYFNVLLGDKWKCSSPKLMIHTDPYGNIILPCGNWKNKFGFKNLSTRNKRIEDVWFSEEGTTMRTMAKGCTSCFMSCNVEPSLLYNNPSNVIFDNLKSYQLLGRRK